MRQFRVWLTIAAVFVVLGGGGAAEAKGKTEKAAGAGPSTKREVNACGCYQDTAGACFCGSSGTKGKCGCPGECEPKGCEEKRAKQMQKEIAAETKKAAEADKKQRKESREAVAKANKADKRKKPSGVGQ
jgi:hypothetical protein